MLPSPFVILPALLATVWAAGGPEAPTVSGFLTETLEASSTVAEAATTASSSGVATHTVNVGASGHKFTPAEVKAEVGDVIEWRFYPSGHNVIRGTFEQPCIPYEYVGLNKEGFSSGAQKVQAITDDGPRFRVRVNNTDPIFFYCGAPGSCVDWHMMGVVNPSKNETLDMWLEKAKDVDYQLLPGEPWPTEDDHPSETASPKESDQEDDDEDKSSNLSPGAIAGIAIGSAAVLLLAGALLYLCGRRGGFDKAYRKSFRGTPNTPVAETQYNSPNPGSPWDVNKPLPGVVAAPFGQSPPMSPHQSVGYGTHPATLAAMMAQSQNPDGTIGSYCSDTYTQHPAPSPSQGGTTPKPPEQTAPAELPASADPGNSPLPTYNNNNNSRSQVFSWAGEETGYRSTNK
ncbi:hypothetical protein NCS52_01046100 [Fusarium sp. LHS14.1]|nr:hypothetical protein NCS52_01046100 [Fusarium sp. LHS14.1]